MRLVDELFSGLVETADAVADGKVAAASPLDSVAAGATPGAGGIGADPLLDKAGRDWVSYFLDVSCGES